MTCTLLNFKYRKVEITDVILPVFGLVSAMILSLEGIQTHMTTMGKVVKQLKKERDLVEKQLSGLNAALSAFAGVYAGTKPTRKKRTISAAGRKRIAAAQRARWAKIKAKKGE